MRADELDPIAQKVADASARLHQIEDGTPEEARAFRRQRGNPFAPNPIQLESIEEREIPISSGSLTIRIYRPFGWKEGSNTGFVFYHGG